MRRKPIPKPVVVARPCCVPLCRGRRGVRSALRTPFLVDAEGGAMLRRLGERAAEHEQSCAERVRAAVAALS